MLVALALLLIPGLAPAQSEGNLVKNGGFEEGLDAWSFGCLRSLPENAYTRSDHGKVAIDAEVFAEGKQSARLDATLPHDKTDPRAVLEQKVARIPAGFYRFSIRYRLAAKPDEGFGLVLSDSGRGGFNIHLAPEQSERPKWKAVERIFRLTGAQSWRVLLYLKGKGTLWYDDVRLTRMSREEYMEATKLPPRDYCIETNLVEAGKPAAVIISSSRQPGYGDIARRVQERIAELSGVELEIVDAEQTTTEEALGRTSAIVLGNLATSKFVETLYWEWYTLLDLWYPGPGGYVVRTLHDPYGTGRNVVFLGGSDDQGVRDAAEAFCRGLEGGEALKVGRLAEIKLGAGHEMPAKGEWLDPRLRVFRADSRLPYGYTSTSRAGLIYYYDGDEQQGKYFRHQALHTGALSNADHYVAHMHAIIWDLIEESPLFSDEDRQKITEKLLLHARGRDGTAGIGHLRSRIAAGQMRERHSSMQAICTLTASRYFGKHWPSEEWEENLAVVREYFDRQMTNAKADSDIGGRGVYTYFQTALIPALLLRDKRFFESGAARQYGELVLMHCDNTGFMPDTGQGGYDNYPPYIFHLCAALCNDGGFLSTMRLRERAERMRGFAVTPQEFMAGQAWATGVEPRVMEKMVGVHHIPLTAWEHEQRGQGIPMEKSFDKLTMRSGFEMEDQYLLLDGLHGGPPGKPWPDVNSIAQFTQNGRTFLVSTIGGENPVNHNVVTVCKDGFGEETDRVASLEAVADLPTFGYSHSRVNKYVFSSWDRHIFWRKGKWFVVLDRLRATDEGHYSFECQWRTIGEPGIGMGSFTSTVWDQAEEDAPKDVLDIQNAERLPIRYSEQLSGLFGPVERKRWEGYCRRKGINRIREVAEREMKPGDEQVFTNLIHVRGDRTPARHVIVKLEEHVAAIRGDENAYVGLATDGRFERGELRIRGEAFCARPESVAVVNGTAIEWGGCTVQASEPCNLELEPARKRVTIKTEKPITVEVNGARHEVGAGLHSVEIAPPPDEAVAALLDQIRRDASEAGGEPDVINLAPDVPDMTPAWTFEAGVEVLGMHAGDVDGDGAVETLLGLADGRAVCLNAEGKQLWKFETGGPVRALARAILDAGLAVIVGSDDEHVYALRPDGSEVLWKHRCKLGHSVTWWTTDMKAKVQAILAEDLGGDGEVEIICATGGGCVETLTSGGEPKWLTAIHWGIPDRLAVVQMGDGTKTLVVSNSYSSAMSTTWRIAADGKLLTGNAFDNGRGGWDMTAAPGLKIADLEGDGKPEAMVGRKGAYNEVGLYDAVTGERKWMYTLGDSVSALEAFDVNGDGRKEVIVGSPSAWLCAFDVDGKQLWARQMPHEVIAIAAAHEGLLVACGDARVYCVESQGRPVGRYDLMGTPLWHFVQAGEHVVIGDSAGHVAALPMRRETEP